MKKNVMGLSLAVSVLMVAFSGCSNKDMQVASLEKELALKNATIAKQDKTVSTQGSEIKALQKALKTDTNTESDTTKTLDTASLIPPNAKLGECYAKVLIPAQYATKSEQKLLTSQVDKLQVTPPTYKNVEYKILQKEESFKYVLKPATYKCVQNRVMVHPEKVTYKIIPATFKTVEEKIMVSPAREIWKKGQGPITKIDNHTGDILCLIEVPAKYKTIKTTVIDEPARTEKIVTPAVYSNIKAKVVNQEASYEKIVIPAIYKTITVQELNTEAVISKDNTQETYQTVQSTYLEKAEELKWERVLCETNTDTNVISKIQEALHSKEYNPGPIDGYFGSQTQRALRSFQVDNELASGAITLESLDALGVR